MPRDPETAADMEEEEWNGGENPSLLSGIAERHRKKLTNRSRNYGARRDTTDTETHENTETEFLSAP
jgi:hypothetical protein